MEYMKVIFKIEDGSASYKKWKETKVDVSKKERLILKGGALERSEKNRAEAKQITTIFEPYLLEIMAQFNRN